jgi:hypothetical protein
VDTVPALNKQELSLGELAARLVLDKSVTSRVGEAGERTAKGEARASARKSTAPRSAARSA